MPSIVVAARIRDSVGTRAAWSFVKVQERSALCARRFGLCGKLGSDRLIHQIKEPDEG